MTQEEALTILKLGHSVFLTGSAGSGKTYVLNQYISWLKAHGVNVAITASTGIAATHIGGTTIHAWSGIGIKDKVSEYDLDELEQNKTVYMRYASTKVLIIDEISMLHAHRLDMVDAIAKKLRKNNKPFGGMQVVFCGDFFQLPPVTRPSTHNPKTHTHNTDFAFCAHVWKQMNPVVCYLATQHRQTDDLLFLLLSQIRSGHVSEDTKKLFLSTVSTASNTASSERTQLFTHNEDVDRINAHMYAMISGEERVFEMSTKGNARMIDGLKQGCLAMDILRLKIGTRVMFIKNDPSKKYFNGTLGTVVRFTNVGTPVIRTTHGNELYVSQDVWQIEEDGKVKAEIRQLPLRYAWAITVHKSQGMTLDSALIDLSKTFSFGMGYVALSRLKDSKDLYVSGCNEYAFEVDPHVKKIDIQFRDRSQHACRAIQKYSKEKLQKLHTDFITHSGGSVEPIQETSIHKSPTTQLGVALTTTYQKTKILLDANMSLEMIAQERGLTVSTIISHIEQLAKDGDCLATSLSFVTQIPHYEQIQKIVHVHATASLKDLKKYCAQKKLDPSFDEIRLVRAFLMVN